MGDKRTDAPDHDHESVISIFKNPLSSCTSFDDSLSTIESAAGAIRDAAGRQDLVKAHTEADPPAESGEESRAS